MNSRWQQVLSAAGARIDGGPVRHFGDPRAELDAALRADVMADLSQLAVIEVSGDDAAAFLSGQLSSDIKSLSPDRSSLSAWCSAQGRVLALFRVFRARGAWFLLLPAELLEQTLKRLRKYVLRAKVAINDLSNDLVRIGLSGPGVTQVISPSILAPAQPETVAHDERASIIRLPDARPRFIIIGDPDFLVTFWETAAAVCRPVGWQAWELLDIDAGVPQVLEATREKFLPQMLNLEPLGGVVFDKGCYPGQEVITRLKFRGQLKQRLYCGRVESNEVPLPGTRLAVNGSDMSAGEVLQACPHPDGGVALTAVAQIELAENDLVHLTDANGPVIRFSSPPYWSE